MRSQAFPKVYRSFEEFERDELRKLDTLTLSIDDMLDDMFGHESEELNFDSDDKKGRGRR
jgi:hypothetical protein